MSNNSTNNLQQIAKNLGLGFAQINNGSSLQMNNGYIIDITEIANEKYSLTLTEFAPIGNCASVVAHQNNLEFVINWLVEYSDMHNTNIAIRETIS